MSSCRHWLQAFTTFVGAPWEDSGSLDPADNSAATSGAVYGFARQKDGWTQSLYLKPDNIASNDAFGTSVLLAGDSLFVGAVGQDPLQWYATGVLARAAARCMCLGAFAARIAKHHPFSCRSEQQAELGHRAAKR